MTKVALASRDHQHLEEKQNPAHREFLFHPSRADYEKQFGPEYQHPGWFARSLAFLFKLIPEFGPLKALQYKDPTPQTEDLYIKSMNDVVRIYVEQAHKMADGTNACQIGTWIQANSPSPANTNWQTTPTVSWCSLLAKHSFASVTPGLRENILWYFSTSNANLSLKRGDRKKTEEAFANTKGYGFAAACSAQSELLPGPKEPDRASGGHFVSSEDF